MTEAEIGRLFDLWSKETSYMSSISMIKNKTFYQLVSAGHPVIEYIYKHKPECLWSLLLSEMLPHAMWTDPGYQGRFALQESYWLDYLKKEYFHEA